MSIAKDFRNAMIKREGIAGTTVYLPFTKLCRIGDIGRVYYNGWKYTSSRDTLPISVPKTVKSGLSSLEINSHCTVEGDLNLNGSTITEDGGELKGSAKITFHKSSSLYFYVPAFYTEEVEMGPETFGNKIWEKKHHPYKLFDNCVYRTYNAKTGIFLGTRTAGMSLTLTADFKNVGNSIKGSFSISNQTNDVVRQEYNPEKDKNNPLAAFACDFFRWKAGGKVIVDPKY